MQSRKWFNWSIIFLMVVAVGPVWAGDSAKVPAGHPQIPGMPSMQGMPSMPMMMPSHEVDTVVRPIDSSYRFVIAVSHRVFENFHEQDTVYLNEKFAVGEGDDTCQVFDFNPHLLITIQGEYLKGSDTLYNPAARVRVFKKDTVVQKNWAFFFSDAPHYRRNDILGFKLVSFEVPDKFIKVAGPKVYDEPVADTTKKPK